MSTTTTIKNAIDRSISHDEIAHVTIDGDSGDVAGGADLESLIWNAIETGRFTA